MPLDTSTSVAHHGTWMLTHPRSSSSLHVFKTDAIKFIEASRKMVDATGQRGRNLKEITM